MCGAEATGSLESGSRLGTFPIPPRPSPPARTNLGANLDRLAELLPVGAAREFVRGLPRRLGREELLASLEALVRLMQVELSRR